MAKRRIPPEIMAHLGPCRKPETQTGEVVEQLGIRMLMGDLGLADYAPLILVMDLVRDEVEELRLSLKGRKGRLVWCEALQKVQEDDFLGHNKLLPCRWCDQAFEPVIDQKLVALYLAWVNCGESKNLLAIHKCPACGGQLAAKRTQTYEEDGHTPKPRSVADDDKWAEQLLGRDGRHCDFDD